MSAQSISEDGENQEKQSDSHQYNGTINCYRLDNIKVLSAEYLK